MAVCYSCGYRHYDSEKCPNCGFLVEYSCWNCQAEIIPALETKCRKCGWYICPDCGACGCDENRPPSLEETGEGWED